MNAEPGNCTPCSPLQGGPLSRWLADALGVRKAALEQALKCSAGPAMVGELVAEVHRLTADYQAALYVEKKLQALGASRFERDNP